MLTWKTHLAALLHRLERAQSRATLAELSTLLAATLDAVAVHFVDAQGHPLPEQMPLAELRKRDYRVRIEVDPTHVPEDQLDTRVEAASRFQPGPAPAPTASEEERLADFIRAFERLDQRSEFMWAGYIVRELLPRFGYPPSQAKIVLDRLCAEGILSIAKVPNPRNPDFPASGVRLNREHEQVRAALGAEPQHAQVSSGEQATDEAPGQSVADFDAQTS